MQNYLQTKKIPSNLRALALICGLALVLSLAVLAMFSRYTTQQADNKYREPLFVTLSEQTAQKEYGELISDEKMNNFPKENAKTDENQIKSALNCRNVRVLLKNGRVSEMELEEYITGCVFGEMPLGFEAEALMAQCVAARTFTARMMCGKSKHKNADVCTSPACCQSYSTPEDSAVSSEMLDKLKGAVSATRGIIMTYEGEPIEAVYHASSGEYTLDSEQVWGARVEYLRSVPSPEGEAELSGVAYGHRVGMSQHGANILAKNGLCFADILKYYYSGISLEFLL